MIKSARYYTVAEAERALGVCVSGKLGPDGYLNEPDVRVRENSARLRRDACIQALRYAVGEAEGGARVHEVAADTPCDDAMSMADTSVSVAGLELSLVQREMGVAVVRERTAMARVHDAKRQHFEAMVPLLTVKATEEARKATEEARKATEEAARAELEKERAELEKVKAKEEAERAELEKAAAVERVALEKTKATADAESAALLRRKATLELAEVETRTTVQANAAAVDNTVSAAALAVAAADKAEADARAAVAAAQGGEAAVKAAAAETARLKAELDATTALEELNAAKAEAVLSERNRKRKLVDDAAARLAQLKGRVLAAAGADERPTAAIHALADFYMEEEPPCSAKTARDRAGAYWRRVRAKHTQGGVYVLADDGYAYGNSS